MTSVLPFSKKLDDLSIQQNKAQALNPNDELTSAN